MAIGSRDFPRDLLKIHPGILHCLHVVSSENIALEKRKREEQKWKMDNKRARKLFPELMPSESEEDNDEEGEQNNTVCGFYLMKYSDPIWSKLEEWIQCQDKGREWYHEKCVGAEGMKKFVCGRCNIKK